LFARRFGCFWAAVVLYDGQRAEHAATDSYFEVLYWRLRKLFKVTSAALFVSVLQTNLTTPFSCFVIALVIIRGGSLNGETPSPQSTQVALNGDWCVLEYMLLLWGFLL
jgi:hypothetical protein